MDKEQIAIERLKTASEMSLSAYGMPLTVKYSGGKDSDVLLELARRAGIPMIVQHSHTSADAPETVRHIRKKFRKLEIGGVECQTVYPVYKEKRATMWNLIPQKGMPPMRRVRYCCEVLKETAGKNRMIATGVRWDESMKRSTRGIYEGLNKNKEKRVILMDDNDDRRQLFERCQLKASTTVNPIIDWSNRDIWEFIRTEGIEYNPLYDCGFSRVGCIGCPMADKGRKKQFAKWPAYKKMYIHAFDRMLERSNWRKCKTGEEVFAWWMEEDLDQLKLFDMEVV